MRIPNKSGGGARTNLNGLKFERDTHLLTALNRSQKYKTKILDDKYSMGEIFLTETNKKIADYFEKHKLYNHFLKKKGVNYETILSKKLLPDGCLVQRNKAYIIEKNIRKSLGRLMKNCKLVTSRRNNIKSCFHR